MAAVTPDVLAPAAFRPGGFTRFLAWVDRLRWHGWWLYVALFVVFVAWSETIAWAAGIVPVGTIDRFLAPGAFYAPYILAAIAYVNGYADRALKTFWPATGWPDSERPIWRRAFLSSPTGYGIPTFIVAVAIAVVGFANASAAVLAPNAPTLSDTSRAILFIAYFPPSLLGYWCALLAFLHTARQLRLVARIHHDAQKIDPFDRAPVYAFSGLTVRTGLAYLFSGYYTLVVNGAFQQNNVAGLSVLVIVFVLSGACFIVPLLGIHGRLVAEKDVLVHDVEVRIGKLGDEMYRRVDAGQFDGVKTITDSLAGIATLRDRIARLPTWPWPPNVLRGFLSALLIPVVVYIVSRLIGGRVGV